MIPFEDDTRQEVENIKKWNQAGLLPRRLCDIQNGRAYVLGTAGRYPDREAQNSPFPRLNVWRY
jgi:hypothetical protein